MKLLLVVFAVILLSTQVRAADPACLESTGIIDYNKGSAYITVQLPWSNELQVIDDLMQRKETWICRFPEKRLVAMTFVYGNDYHGNIITKGLLIHYEWKKPS